MVDVIKWDQTTDDEIVYTYPGTEFQWGSQLIVDESQQAVFYRDGKAYDVIGPGRTTLTTANLPLLTKAFKLVFGKSPFQCKVVFVTVRKAQGKFGTPQPVMLKLSNDPQVPKFVQVGRIAGAVSLRHTACSHGPPFVMIAVQPDLRQVFKRGVLGDLLDRQMTVIINDRHILGIVMKKKTCRPGM